MEGITGVVFGAEDVAMLVSCGVDVVDTVEVGFGVDVVGMIRVEDVVVPISCEVDVGRFEVEFGVDVVGTNETMLVNGAEGVVVVLSCGVDMVVKLEVVTEGVVLKSCGGDVIGRLEVGFGTEDVRVLTFSGVGVNSAVVGETGL